MIEYYRGIADDPLRQAAFERAITAVVRPGDVVVDLGCAMGTFSVYACRAGASRVYAVEAEPIIEVAREVVEANGCADRVRFLAGRSTALEVPEPAQVVVFEDFSSMLLTPSVVRTLQDLTRRWLAPGGKLLPDRARLWVAPVEDPAGHRERDRFAWTQDRVFGVDLSPSRRAVFSTTHGTRLQEGALLAPPTLACDIDLKGIEDGELRASGRVGATRGGAIHGLLLWFDLQLAGSWLGTGPRSGHVAWGQVLFPLETPLVVDAREELELELESSPFGDDVVSRWRVTVGDRSCEGNSLAGLALRADQLARWDPEQQPSLGPELEVDRVVLGAVDGQNTLADIAALLARRFPDRFGRPEDAQRRVLAVLGRHAA